MSSLATFVVGIVAIRTLTPADLGTYSVLFAAFLVGSLVPTEAHFRPRLISSIRAPANARLNGVARTVGAAVRPGAIGAGLVVLSALAIWRGAHLAFLIPELLAAMLLVPVSPAQDYVRRCFHLSEQSWKASLVSAGQLVSVVAIVAAANRYNLSITNRPLTMLLLANCASLSIALFLAGKPAFSARHSVHPTVRGETVLFSSLLVAGGGLLSSVLMSLIAGPVTAGYAEAARTVAQPVLVVATGLSSAFTSRVHSAVYEGDRAKAEHANRLFHIFMILTAGVFLALFAFEGPSQIIGDLVPAVLAVPGLVLVATVGNLVFGISINYRDQLIAGGREDTLLRTDKWGIVFPIATALATPWLGAFARGIGLVLQSTYSGLRYRTVWTGLFNNGHAEGLARHESRRRH